MARKAKKPKPIPLGRYEASIDIVKIVNGRVMFTFKNFKRIKRMKRLKR